MIAKLLILTISGISVAAANDTPPSKEYNLRHLQRNKPSCQAENASCNSKKQCCNLDTFLCINSICTADPKTLPPPSPRPSFSPSDVSYILCISCVHFVMNNSLIYDLQCILQIDTLYSTKQCKYSNIYIIHVLVVSIF